MAPNPPREPHLWTTPKAPPLSPAQNSVTTPGLGGSAGEYVDSAELQAADSLVQQQMAHQAANMAVQEWMMQQQLLQQSGAPVHLTYAQMVAQQQCLAGAAQLAQPMMVQAMMAQPTMAQPGLAQVQPAQVQPQPAQVQPAQVQPAMASAIHPVFPAQNSFYPEAVDHKVPEPTMPPTNPPQWKAPSNPDDGQEWSGGSSSQRDDWKNWKNWKNDEKWDDQKWSDQGYGQWRTSSWKSWDTWAEEWAEDDNQESQYKEPEMQEPEPEESIQKFSVILDQYTTNFPCPFHDEWIWIRMRRPPPAVSPHVVPAKRKVDMESSAWKAEETEDVKCEDYDYDQ